MRGDASGQFRTKSAGMEAPCLVKSGQNTPKLTPLLERMSGHPAGFGGYAYALSGHGPAELQDQLPVIDCPHKDLRYYKKLPA